LVSVFIQCERSFLKHNTTYRSRKAVNDVAQDETERLQGWSHPEAPCCKASHKHDRDPGPKVGITQHTCRADVKPHEQGVGYRVSIHV
jgi:hypothetical protein